MPLGVKQRKALARLVVDRRIDVQNRGDAEGLAPTLDSLVDKDLARRTRVVTNGFVASRYYPTMEGARELVLQCLARMEA